MSVRIALAALILSCTACAPQSVPQAPPRPNYRTDLGAGEAEACRKAGGEVRRVCKLQNERCIRSFEDAGKPCTDNDQCEGLCLADQPVEPGKPAAGTCQKTDDPCGCRTDVRNGVAGQGICVD